MTEATVLDPGAAQVAAPEARYVQSASMAHRRAFGQFFTPEPVAQLMADWVLQGRPRTILDPAYGMGIFYRRIRAAAGDVKFRFTGYELDAQVLAAARAEHSAGDSGSALHLVNEDYLAADVQGYDAVICNPPYMRFQKLVGRHEILDRLQAESGIRLGGCANSASVFLLKALHQLNAGGRLAFILPMEFFNTNYGLELRRKLAADCLLKQVLIFANEKELFPEAVTTVVVLLCENDGRPSGVSCRTVNNLHELRGNGRLPDSVVRHVEYPELLAAVKWSPVFENKPTMTWAADRYVPFSHYGRFRRGIATGANRFFVFNREQAEQRGLPMSQLQACVTRSTQVPGMVFSDTSMSALDRDGRPVWCLNPAEPMGTAVRDYLSLGEQQGVHQCYLTSKRNPWYKLEVRSPAPIWVGTFYRQRLKVIRNFSSAPTFTCFHSFYPAPDFERLVDALFVYLLSDAGQSQVCLQRRQYGDGLVKFEPGDLNQALCPGEAQLRKLDQERVQSVIRLAAIDPDQALDAANELFPSVFSLDGSARAADILDAVQ